jgi:hypothetical protein
MISADRREVRAIGEDNAGEPSIGWMMGNIYALKSQLRDGGGALDGESRRQNRVTETKAKLIQPSAADLVVVGDQETPIVLSIHVVWKQRIYDVDQEIFQLNRA